MNRILREFGLETETNENSLLNNLYQVPKQDKGPNMPHFQYPDAGQIVQADILYMPNDQGYKYMLVVVDNGSRLIDAEPMKTHNSKATVEAFTAIFKRKLVTMPQYKIEVDAGSEFRGSTIKYFQDNEVKVRVAPTGRHRMQGLVERTNQTLGTILHKRMTGQELLTGATSKHWVKDLPKLVKAVNTYVAEREEKRKKKLDRKPLPDHAVCAGQSCNLLSIGDKVRVALEFPQDLVTGQKLHGKFRSSDIRFNPKVRMIKEVLLKPNFPPMYLLDGNVGTMKITPVAYTRNQLQLIPKNEKLPNTNIIRGKPKQFIPEALVGRKKINGKIHYHVKWMGWDSKDNTWEPAKTLKLEVPELVAEYEQN